MELQEAFDHLYSTYFGENQHEREEVENFPKLLQDCEIFIDVGASLGMYTYYANKHLKNAKIIAVEADPDRYEELKKNCQKWEAEGSNTLIAVHAAMGDDRSPICFYKTGTQISGGFFPVTERSEDYIPVEVRQILLDDFYEDGKRTFVKVDVEGAELRVLKGSKKHLASGNTRFLIEMHWWGDRDRRTTTADVLRYLYAQHFAIERTVRVHTSNYHVYPARERNVLNDYLKVAPLLLVKTFYGKYVPKPVRDLREQFLNRRRRRKHKKS